MVQAPQRASAFTGYFPLGDFASFGESPATSGFPAAAKDEAPLFPTWKAASRPAQGLRHFPSGGFEDPANFSDATGGAFAARSLAPPPLFPAGLKKASGRPAQNEGEGPKNFPLGDFDDPSDISGGKGGFPHSWSTSASSSAPPPLFPTGSQKAAARPAQDEGDGPRNFPVGSFQDPANTCDGDGFPLAWGTSASSSALPPLFPRSQKAALEATEEASEDEGRGPPNFPVCSSEDAADFSGGEGGRCISTSSAGWNYCEGTASTWDEHPLYDEPGGRDPWRAEAAADPLRGALHLENLLLKKIKFTQDSVSKEFQDGRTLVQTMQEIRRGIIAFPPIRVVKSLEANAYFSLDNRRLKCLKEAYTGQLVEVQLVSLEDPEIRREFQRKMTTGGNARVRYHSRRR